MSICQSRLGLARRGPGLLCKDFSLHSTRTDEVSKVLKWKNNFEGRICILPEFILKNMFAY